MRGSYAVGAAPVRALGPYGHLLGGPNLRPLGPEDDLQSRSRALLTRIAEGPPPFSTRRSRPCGRSAVRLPFAGQRVPSGSAEHILEVGKTLDHPVGRPGDGRVIS